jgi:hypothetical protein
MIDKIKKFRDDHVYDGQFFVATTESGREKETILAQITLAVILFACIISGFIFLS